MASGFYGKKRRRGKKKKEEEQTKEEQICKVCFHQKKTSKAILPFLILKIGNLFFFSAWDKNFFFFLVPAMPVKYTAFYS